MSKSRAILQIALVILAMIVLAELFLFPILHAIKGY